MSKYLTLITDKQRRGSLSIYNSELIDIEEEGTGDISITNDINIIDNSYNQFRPIKCSELYNKLISKCFLNFGIKYVSTNSEEFGKDFIVRNKVSAPEYQIFRNNIPLIYTDIVKNRSIDKDLFSNGFKVNRFEMKEDVLDEADKVYKEFFGSMNEVDGLYILDTLKNDINILEKSASTLNIIRQDSDIYINSLNLNELIRHTVKKDLSGLVNLTIQYSKNKEIYSSDINFLAFTYKYYNSELNLIMDNIYSEFNNDIRLEYINGEIKLYPLNDSISEYIISNCTMIYG